MKFFASGGYRGVWTLPSLQRSEPIRSARKWGTAMEAQSNVAKQARRAFWAVMI